MKLFKLIFISIIFIGGIFLPGKTFAQAQDPYLPYAEVMPQPIGGLGAIYKHITYPEIAKKAGVEGKVYLLVYINEKGGVDNVKVIKGLGAGCDQAAINGIKEIKFTPAKDKGVPVKVKLSLSITFKLQQ